MFFYANPEFIQGFYAGAFAMSALVMLAIFLARSP